MLIQDEFKVVRREALLVVDKRVNVLTGVLPSPFPSLDSQGMLKLKIILIEHLFIYLFQSINKKKQECQGKNILIHVSEHNTGNNHITELKNDYSLHLVLIFFTDMNCVFHSRK